MPYHRDDTFLKQLGERIRQLRKKANMTQFELAYELNVPTSQIGRMERGETNFSVSYLSSLSKVFGVPMSDLLV